MSSEIKNGDKTSESLPEQEQGLRIVSGGESLDVFEIMCRFRTDGSCEHLIKEALMLLARADSEVKQSCHCIVWAQHGVEHPRGHRESGCAFTQDSGKAETAPSYSSVVIPNHSSESAAPLIQQLCRDLNEAHNEILRLQNVTEDDFGKWDWPEWSPQANSIRWAERVLQGRLAKTTQWTLFPPLCRCPPNHCLLKPSQTTCSSRERPPLITQETKSSEASHNPNVLVAGSVLNETESSEPSESEITQLREEIETLKGDR